MLKGLESELDLFVFEDLDVHQFLHLFVLFFLRFELDLADAELLFDFFELSLQGGDHLDKLGPLIFFFVLLDFFLCFGRLDFCSSETGFEVSQVVVAVGVVDRAE